MILIFGRVGISAAAVAHNQVFALFVVVNEQ
jgi:hypothetical protein